MFKELEGPINREVRERAVSLTGLKWSKIYKWMFDNSDKLPNIKRQESGCSTDFEKLDSADFRGLKLFEVTKSASSRPETS